MTCQFGTTENKFNSTDTLWPNILFKNSTEAKQEGIDRGYFEIVEGSKTAKEKTFTYHTTRVTGKGQVYIINKLLKEQEVV